MSLRVPCHGRARPGPSATVSSASSVSAPYAPGPWQRGHMGGCHASASITIRGWSVQRLPTATAHITIVMAATYYIILPPIMMMYVGDGPVKVFLIFVFYLQTKQDMIHLCKRSCISFLRGHNVLCFLKPLLCQPLIIRLLTSKNPLRLRDKMEHGSPLFIRRYLRSFILLF